MDGIEFPEMAEDGQVNLIIGCQNPDLLRIIETSSSADGKTCCVRTPLGWSAIGASVANKERLSYGKRLNATAGFIQGQGGFLAESLPGEWFEAIDFCEKPLLKDGNPEIVLRDVTNDTALDAAEVGEVVLNCARGSTSTSENKVQFPEVSEKGNRNERSYKEIQISEESEEERLLQQIETLLKSQWEVENQGESQAMSKEDEYSVRQMESSRVKRGEKYEMSCLWKKGCPSLTSNLKYALSRLDSLLRSKKLTPSLREQYGAILQEWVDKGYVRRLDSSKLSEKDCWFLPHFPVIRQDKNTTKIRPVFDGKASAHGQSLNEQIHSGPNLICNLNQVLQRFRRNAVTLGMDIREMFMQICLDEKSRQYHRFLWRNSEDKLVLYELQRHPFGNPGSPGVSIYHTQATAREFAKEYPIAAESILESTLMDDVLDSYNSIREGKEALKGAMKIFEAAGMVPHKFISNKEEVLSSVKPEDRAKGIAKELAGERGGDGLPVVKVLGLIYLPAKDLFTFRFVPPERAVWTKRGVAQTFPTIYDPLGFIGPFTLEARIILQESFARKIGWDEALPSDLKVRWNEWLMAAKALEEIEIARCTRELTGEDLSREFICIFSDASEKGYSSTSYRVTSSMSSPEKWHVAFLQAKTKVAPLKALSIPRLELLAAELSMSLYLEIKKTYKLEEASFRFFTDSQDVLYWLKSESKHLSRFVAHRISKIQDNTPVGNWFHVKSKWNPADVGSRGRSAKELGKEGLWWNGPSFLKDFETQVKEEKPLDGPSDAASKEYKGERGAVLTILHKGKERKALQLVADDRLHPRNFSDLDRFIRVLALIRKGCRRWRARALKEVEEEEPSHEEEMKLAENDFLEFVQREALGEEIHSLNKRGIVASHSKLAQYCPFLDKEGLLRVGGRLQYIRGWSFDQRCPLILPSNYGANLVLQRIHSKEHLHALGAAALKARFAERFFMLGLTTMSRKVCKDCLPCKRILVRPVAMREAPLPDFRVGKRSERPPIFNSVQMDWTGPVMVKSRRGMMEKKYILVIVCHTYKAVHLEVLPSLTSESLLMALQRFTSRRGGVAHIWTDNAKGFEGGASRLEKTVKSLQVDDLVINWEFGSPWSPNHQGLVEADIQSLKRAIEATLSNRTITLEELETLAVTIESLMNARPLAFVEMRGLERAMTPGDVMGMNGMARFSDFPFNKIKSMGSRWIKLNRILDLWWKLFFKTYIPTLHRRNGRSTTQRELEVGDIVLLRDHRNPRGRWPVGKVVKPLTRARQTETRTFEVLVDGNMLVRSAGQLCLLTPKQ